MKTIFFAIALATIVATTATVYAQPVQMPASPTSTTAVGTDDAAAAIARAKSVMSLKLKDADSAHYVGLSVGHGIVCGWVNSRNSFGAYVGYKPFYVNRAVVEFRDDDSDAVFNNHMTFAMMWYLCKPSDQKRLGDVLLKLPDINIARQCAKVRKFTHRTPAEDPCENAESDAEAWLASHPTADWIAEMCGRKLQDDDSYSSGRSCVLEQESSILFREGPPTTAAQSP